VSLCHRCKLKTRKEQIYSIFRIGRNLTWPRRAFMLAVPNCQFQTVEATLQKRTNVMPNIVMMSRGATCPSQVSRRKIGSMRFVYSVTCQSFIIAWENLPLTRWQSVGRCRGEVCLHPSDGQLYQCFYQEKDRITHAFNG